MVVVITMTTCLEHISAATDPTKGFIIHQKPRGRWSSGKAYGRALSTVGV
jgi:hypothetical protein